MLGDGLLRNQKWSVHLQNGLPVRDDLLLLLGYLQLALTFQHPYFSRQEHGDHRSLLVCARDHHHILDPDEVHPQLGDVQIHC